MDKKWVLVVEFYFWERERRIRILEGKKKEKRNASEGEKGKELVSFLTRFNPSISELNWEKESLLRMREVVM